MLGVFGGYGPQTPGINRIVAKVKWHLSGTLPTPPSTRRSMGRSMGLWARTTARK